MICKNLFVHPILLIASDSAVCLCKFHQNLTNGLKFNMQAILQRGRVLTAFRPSEQLNINAMNKGDLFVALTFNGVI